MRLPGLTALFLPLALLAACERGSPPPPAPSPPAPISTALTLRPASYAELPGWPEDRIVEALPALRSSCRRILKLEDAAPVGANAIGGTALAWKGPCGELAAIPGYADLPTTTFSRPVSARHWLQASNPSERWKWDFMFQDLPPVKFGEDFGPLPRADVIPLKEVK